ncbi:MAG: hypothetical protein V4631_19545 [Pseudomonadota bacterium]
MNLDFSRRLALAFGILLPIAETVRRWHQLGQPAMLPAWLDDILLGAFLVYAGVLTARERVRGQRFLAAAWGCACGMGYFSFFGQLARFGQPDPAPIPSSWVLVIKGVGLVLAFAALIGALREAKP